MDVLIYVDPSINNQHALESAENNMSELTAQAQTFADKQLPLLKALQIA